MLEILGCADDVPESHDPADCPVCRHALGLPEPATLVLSPEIWCDECGAWHIPTSCSAQAEPVDAAGEGRRNEDARPIGPPFTMPDARADDVPDATITIEPDVSGFEGQS